MAAGLGSRFGGVKQLARVGPNGEAFLDLSIKDALNVGFTDVVVIVRSEIEQDVADHIESQHAGTSFSYVRQDDFGPTREKPWGTMHAILSAAKAIDNPFCVVNADDYYGPTSFRLAFERLANVSPTTSATVAFEMGKTLPPTGSVSRGVCQVVDGKLLTINEAEVCERHADGTITADGIEMEATTPVSMNMWCFHHGSLDNFNQRWLDFYEESKDEPKAECQLPTVVSELMSEHKMMVEVVSSPEQWIGITNPEDLELAKAALSRREKLTKEGPKQR